VDEAREDLEHALEGGVIRACHAGDDGALHRVDDELDDGLELLVRGGLGEELAGHAHQVVAVGPLHRGERGLQLGVRARRHV
jgi:hypothetical protein